MTIISSDVRRAEKADAKAIANVHWQAWQHGYAGLIPHIALQHMLTRRNSQWWLKAVDGPATLLVLEVDARVVGYATVGLSRARSLLQEGEIYEIYLLPTYQGLGFGRRLFREAQRLLASLGCKGVIAWCLEDLDQATGFFTALGGRRQALSIERFGDKCLDKVAFAWD
ncbi:GNAT family N-acetyltransferase [Martelella sp. HB161492]|uniref:GNAT family N-acetyltransferase n=1 Tax=Martelella sp. HB161492 TaxID=2720726 RepID=UPI00158FA6C9|nr:GNAT family N-acetyltransferase [Martelella sp. HB161492]